MPGLVLGIEQALGITCETRIAAVYRLAVSTVRLERLSIAGA
jgi:hypothetical protein